LGLNGDTVDYYSLGYGLTIIGEYIRLNAVLTEYRYFGPNNRRIDGYKNWIFMPVAASSIDSDFGLI